MPISRCDCAGYRLLLGLTLMIVTWLALTPQPPTLQADLMLDKWSHMLAFVVLAFLVDASWPDRTFDPAKWIPLFLYGVALEAIQMQIPNRIFDVADVGANAIGILLYAVAGVRLLKRFGMR